MPEHPRAQTERWKKTYQRHGTELAGGFKKIVTESAASTTRTLKKYTNR